MFFLYQILIIILLIFSPLIIFFRILKKKEDRKRYKEKFCFPSKRRINGNLIWFHGASVGELQSIIPLLEKFEKNFLSKYKSKYGVAVGSGTDALYISLKALNIKKGDEVITAANTAIPTISAIVNSGAVPKLVDIGEDFLIDPLKNQY